MTLDKIADAFMARHAPKHPHLRELLFYMGPVRSEKDALAIINRLPMEDVHKLLELQDLLQGMVDTARQINALSAQSSN